MPWGFESKIVDREGKELPADRFKAIALLQQLKKQPEKVGAESSSRRGITAQASSGGQSRSSAHICEQTPIAHRPERQSTSVLQAPPVTRPIACS